MKTLIVQKDDVKSKKWREGAASFGLDVIAQKGSPIRGPLFLLKTVIHKKKPNGYVIRYLNDYPSFFKTIIRTGSEIFLITACRLLQVKLFWICHNVDKETNRSYPTISNFRRKLVSRFCERIFVTDALLKEKASRIFPKYKKKIDSISFGEIDIRNQGSGDNQSEWFIKEKKREAFEKGRRSISVLCAGTPNNPKYLHFEYLIEFMQRSRDVGYDIVAVVAGAWDSSKRSQDLLVDYKNHSNILVFEEYTTFSNLFIVNNIDCYFRGYDDYSVPFSVYEACSLSKPVLALDNDFLPALIRHYKIGQVIDMEFSNIEMILERLLDLDQYEFKSFLEQNNWSVFAKRLLPLL